VAPADSGAHSDRRQLQHAPMGWATLMDTGYMNDARSTTAHTSDNTMPRSTIYSDANSGAHELEDAGGFRSGGVPVRRLQSPGDTGQLCLLRATNGGFGATYARASVYVGRGPKVESDYAYRGVPFLAYNLGNHTTVTYPTPARPDRAGAADLRSHLHQASSHLLSGGRNSGPIRSWAGAPWSQTVSAARPRGRSGPPNTSANMGAAHDLGAVWRTSPAAKVTCGFLWAHERLQRLYGDGSSGGTPIPKLGLAGNMGVHRGLQQHELSTPTVRLRRHGRGHVQRD